MNRQEQQEGADGFPCLQHTGPGFTLLRGSSKLSAREGPWIVSENGVFFKSFLFPYHGLLGSIISM